jgi:hypothetical protein
MGSGHLNELEAVLQKIITIAPEQVLPESYYNLAALNAVLGKSADALANLRVAMDLNAKRLQRDPRADDLAAANRSDTRFDPLRSLPEFQKIVPPK